MTATTDIHFRRAPQRRLRRLALIAAAGAVLVFGAWQFRLSRRPRELPAAQNEVGLGKVREIMNVVERSTFGGTPRGRRLTSAARAMVRAGRVRFSPELEGEALYRRELGCAPVLYISVAACRDRVLWPAQARLAERLYHETLHAVVDSESRSWEEECDAFCAAEQARAAVAGEAPRYPVRRDGVPVWDWVRENYPHMASAPGYVPVGLTRAELGGMSGGG
jgi:hypothetical protein